MPKEEVAQEGEPAGSPVQRVAVGSDHAGYEGPPPFYKPFISEFLAGHGVEVVDCGTSGPESVDYPDYANRVCETILEGRADWGVLICGTGIGVSMAANRHRGIRAAVCTTPEMAELARRHNNANVLCLGRRVLTLEQCQEVLAGWMKTPFSGEPRHERRVQKMD
jgi:ribose 5-phosphate isomerase B